MIYSNSTSSKTAFFNAKITVHQVFHVKPQQNSQIKFTIKYPNNKKTLREFYSKGFSHSNIFY